MTGTNNAIELNRPDSTDKEKNVQYAPGKV